MPKKNKRKKDKNEEEQFDDYLANLYGLESVVGYTESGAPYGAKKDAFDNDNDEDEDIDLFLSFVDDNDIPF